MQGTQVDGAAACTHPHCTPALPCLQHTPCTPQAYDLDMKPDVSAPGALYSSLPGGAAQTWSGTSMAAPYVAGVAALWKEAVMRRQGHLRPPLGGWVDAAAAARKNTARPRPYRGSPQLMWPPVKVGAGVVQALHAAVTRVTVTPTELLARTDVSSQRLRLTLRNSGVTDVTYALAHRPGVSVSLATAWYGRALDATLPTASVVVAPRVVTVAAGATASVQVRGLRGCSGSGDASAAGQQALTQRPPRRACLHNTTHNGRCTWPSRPHCSASTPSLVAMSP
jgi:subtilisin family serine protease